MGDTVCYGRAGCQHPAGLPLRVGGGPVVRPRATAHRLRPQPSQSAPPLCVPGTNAPSPALLVAAAFSLCFLSLVVEPCPLASQDPTRSPQLCGTAPLRSPFLLPFHHPIIIFLPSSIITHPSTTQSRTTPLSIDILPRSGRITVPAVQEKFTVWSHSFVTSPTAVASAYLALSCFPPRATPARQPLHHQASSRSLFWVAGAYSPYTQFARKGEESLKRILARVEQEKEGSPGRVHWMRGADPETHPA
ncbi:hypothetical protein M432DRAFT_64954 [Thermoascus aurantiacus ATCC 26904]